MRVLTLALISALALMGCDDAPDPAAPETEVTPGAGGDEAPAAPEAPAGPTATGESFELTTTTNEAAYPSGQLAQFGIQLVGRDGWHVNQEFPISVELRAPTGVTFAKSTLERGDAAEFGDESARFDVPFTPTAAGQHAVEAEVFFAMCTDSNCVPEQRTLALNLAVE